MTTFSAFMFACGVLVVVLPVIFILRAIDHLKT